MINTVTHSKFTFEPGQLEARLFDEGLVRYGVDENGLKLELTPEGYASFSRGGPGQLLLAQWTKQMKRRNTQPLILKYVGLITFYSAMIICFFFNSKKG